MHLNLQDLGRFSGDCVGMGWSESTSISKRWGAREQRLH